MSLRHGPKHTGSGLNDDVWNQLEKIADVSRKLAQRIRTPTHPVYDSTNFPPNATRGQIVRDVNDPDVVWVFGEDDEWHKIGGASDVYWAWATQGGYTIPAPAAADNYDVGFGNIEWHGGAAFVEESDGLLITGNALGIKQQGDYLIMSSLDVVCFSGAIPASKILALANFVGSDTGGQPFPLGGIKTAIGSVQGGATRWNLTDSSLYLANNPPIGAENLPNFPVHLWLNVQLDGNPSGNYDVGGKMFVQQLNRR